MITAILFIVFGLTGFVGGIILLKRGCTTTNAQEQILLSRGKRLTVIGTICCHGLLILMGSLILLQFTIPVPWLIFLCTITMMSRLANGGILFHQIRWAHQLTASLILAGGLFFYF